METHNITFEDFNRICRFCLKSDGFLKLIFKDEEESGHISHEKIIEMITTCVGVEINHNDGLPIFICNTCFDKLENCNDFKKQCIASTNYLRQIKIKHDEAEYFDDVYDDNSYEVKENLSDSDIKNEELSNEMPIQPEIVMDPNDVKPVVKKKKRGRPRNPPAERMPKLKTVKLKNRPEMCEICGTMQTNIKVHLPIHDPVKGFECAYCTKQFAQKSSLHSHFKIHINERPHQCQICPYKFHQAAHLRRHMCTHTGERKFKCDMCPKAFAQSSTLSEHRLSHTQDRRVPCPHCDKMFLTRKALKSHVGIHTGERPFKCETCGVSYVSSSSLSAHRRIHKRENPTVQCEICYMVFESRTMLKSHMRDHGLTTLATHLEVFIH